MMEERDYSALPAFLAGAFIGAGIALLLAPRSGSEVRGMLWDYANQAKDQIMDKGQEAWNTAVDQGKEYMDRGRETMREAGQTAREYMQSGSESLRETTSKRG